MGSKQNPLHAQFAAQVLAEVVRTGAVVGWLATLSEYGGPGKEGKATAPPNVRVSAAKAGLDFVSKFIDGSEGSAAGASLIAELEKLQETAAAVTGEASLPEGDDNDTNT